MNMLIDHRSNSRQQGILRFQNGVCSRAGWDPDESISQVECALRPVSQFFRHGACDVEQLDYSWKK
jgi:hypothetical protein